MKRRLSLSVREELATRIASGAIAAGSRLPAEPQLATELGVSRATLREALRSLEEDGFVTRTRGAGTYATSRPRLRNNLDVNFGVTEAIRAAGMRAGTAASEITSARASAEDAEALDLASGDAILVLERVRSADDRPVVISRDVLSAALVSAETLAGLSDRSVYDLLEEVTGAAVQQQAQSWVRFSTNIFNLGGLIGTLLTVPLAKHMGRKKMFTIYYALSAAAVMLTFGPGYLPHDRLWGYFFIGLTVFGVFGSFTYYLPELFPTRLRATGSGFCYNVGRIIAAAGPFIVGRVASMGTDSLQTALQMLFWVGAVPAAGLLLMPFVIETRHRELAD